MTYRIHGMNDICILHIHGPDAEKFLQGQLTCDTRKVDEHPVLAAHCNPQGRIISLFWIFKEHDGFTLVLPDDMQAIAKAALDKYRVFFKAEIDILTASADLPEICLLSREEKIQQGIPSVYATTSEKFLPHRLNLLDFGGVSFTKGCYTGQEIIARMQHRGEVKHHLYQLPLEIILSPGDKYQSAVIVDCATIDNNILALAIIKDSDAADLGATDLRKQA